MDNITSHITIPGNTSSNDDLDLAFLKQKGIEYIEKLGGKLWTDYNTHDPGITTLELLAYAITDLGLRMKLPIEDLLSSNSNHFTPLKEQFFSAENILPSSPVTAIDYRKLFIDIDGVKNAWIEPYSKKVFIDEEHKQISYWADRGSRFKSVHLKGLYHILIELEELNPNREQKEEITEKVKLCYHENRNLCEDLVSINHIDEEQIKVCANIELVPEADEELVHAKVLRAVDQYLNPKVKFHSLNAMLEKGYSVEEIFDGPLLKNGFIDTKELEQSELIKAIHLSDITRIIMEIDEVALIKDISIGRKDEDTSRNEDKVWSIQIKDGVKPIRCQDSTFNYCKGLLPLIVNEKKVEAYTKLFEEQEQQEAFEISQNTTLSIPKGDQLDIGEYTSIQSTYPENYGLSEFGLSADASPQRKAQAKQLKAYLLFFDQILASYFAQLSKVKDLLSVNNTNSNTYFSQVVKDVVNIEDLVSKDYLGDNNERLFTSLFEQIKSNKAKRNQILDHLLARFAENFSQYAFIMKDLYGTNSEEAIIKAKEGFLNNYAQLSATRGLGFNKLSAPETMWDSDNVSGYIKRLSLLAGISNCNRRNISSDKIEVYQEKDSDGLNEYRWRIRGYDRKIMLSSSQKYTNTLKLYEEIKQVQDLGTNPKAYEIKRAKNGKYHINMVNPEIKPGKKNYIIARRIEFFSSSEEAQQVVQNIMTVMEDKHYNEGIFLVEHILLRPNSGQSRAIAPEAFLPPIELDNGIIEPYSFQLTIVLPGWTKRFSNLDYRTFMEDLIRKELPAHLFPQIRWVGYQAGKFDENENNDLVEFEKSWKTYLETMNDKDEGMNILPKLNHDLCQLNNIYPSATLQDCEDDNDKIKGKLILGKSVLGQL